MFPSVLEVEWAFVIIFQMDRWMNESVNRRKSGWPQVSKVPRSKDKDFHVFEIWTPHIAQRGHQLLRVVEKLCQVPALLTLMRFHCYTQPRLSQTVFARNSWLLPARPYFCSLPQIQLSELFASATEKQGPLVIYYSRLTSYSLVKLLPVTYTLSTPPPWLPSCGLEIL